MILYPVYPKQKELNKQVDDAYPISIDFNTVNFAGNVP